MEIYLVGGAVRDQLLNQPVKDRDWVVVGATAQQMLEQGYEPVGKDFPVFLHPETHEEYALARTERKNGQGYTGFECYSGQDVSLEEDLQRRDLTINAMAMDQQGRLIDPYRGQQDLQRKLLRHVSPAFAEDPLRVLRVARFYARYHHLGFSIAEETLQLMKEISQGDELTALTVERVWQETERALLETTPAAYIRVLHQCGALAKLFPDLEDLFGVPQPEQFHPEIDTGEHTLMAVEQAHRLSLHLPTEQRLQTIYAALTHDLGKGKTPKHHWPKHHGHEDISELLARQMAEHYKVPNQFKRISLLVAKYHTHIHRAFELKPATLMRVLEALDAVRRPDTLTSFLLACEADAKGRLGLENRDYPQADYVRDAHAAIAAISAKNLVNMGLRGAAIGEELRKLRIRAIRQVKSKYIRDDL